ncbi:hypothetical protein RvY_09681 [Ramazzottius varieornatus]|uniref:Uncharacterized protein n=1 Tax=Ramazzottius varieornatus TaxID=947166 RepID=A0A1D1VA79_RAMVA|nr:hypothetical protein RvY_09681 [Ramazzottius varieornatus]
MGKKSWNAHIASQSPITVNHVSSRIPGIYMTQMWMHVNEVWTLTASPISPHLSCLPILFSAAVVQGNRPEREPRSCPRVIQAGR